MLVAEWSRDGGLSDGPCGIALWRRPFPVGMLYRLRSALPVRSALCLAAVLSVGGSVGLHPEPSSAKRPPDFTSFAAAAAPKAGSPTHTCLTCLLYGSAFPSWSSAVVHGILPSLSTVPTDLATRTGSLVAPCHDGRAPPAVL
jgi:hypothetical protein